MHPIFDVLQVYNVGGTKVRFGGPHDGGYVVNTLATNAAQHLISAGIGCDTSFEESWIKETGTNIRLCDASCACPPKLLQSGRVRYTAKFIGTSPGYIPLKILLRKHPTSFVKLDIEGGEYVVFQDTDLSTITGLVLEVHFLNQAGYLTKFLELMTNRLLPSGLILNHIHGNSFGTTFNIDGKPIPETLELSFVHQRLAVQKVLEDAGFPVSGLDFSNSANPDCNLEWINQRW
jgi:hypothetical protein